MTSTSTSSHAPRWPIVLIAVVGLVLASPFILAFLVAGIALTVGLAGTLIKAGVVVFAIWALVMVFKALFGSHRHSNLPRPVEHIPTATRVDPEAEIERERRESLAALDRELALAIARKNDGEAK